ncbi:polygalacturonase [Arcticibacter pallidicorallinus]|uniref:Polygalacturonase n=1 Tax=Arcticibacter pallidicorallinus TaxID=1259464 RepID=A0A2T0U8T6_9SPHI|nr:glycoside hydrolase family 28 protein [Arcticibacter pallidicorallinus]PRY54247.1 polygalacturonase [Arcticibacter pallidicorallinus]
MNNTRNLKVAIVASILQLTGFQSFSQLQSPSWPINVLPIVEKPVFKADTFNIVKYGAINDGLTLNTKSINAAIEACSANGGGVVLVPAGLWSTGPVELKSNVNLHLKSDAVLSFSRDKSQYKLIEANWEGLAAVRNQPPISGTGLENVAITGKGIVDGNGDSWRMVKREKLTANQWEKLISSGGALDQSGKIWYPSASSLKGSQTNNAGAIAPGKTAKDYEDIKDFLRPNLLVLTKTKNILLEGVTFQNSPAWNVHPIMCENIIINNIVVRNPWYGQNGDGLDLESCKNVVVENSVFDVGDDAICIKSGRDEEGRKRGIPTENVLVKNCTVYHGHGGFVVGSEMSGGAKNLFITDCTFIGTDIGLRFKTTRGRGGVVEKVYIKNITMKDIPGEAVLFDMYYGAKSPVFINDGGAKMPKEAIVPVNEGTPQFKDIHVNNLVCDGAARGIFVRGLPEMNIQNIHLENITIQANNGIQIQDAKRIHFRNVNLIVKNTQPVVDIMNSSGLTFDGLKYNEGAELIFDVKGERSTNITLRNAELKSAKSIADFKYGATKKALKTQ